MPKARQHWIHDLLAGLAVLAVAGLVFWLMPLPAQAGEPASAPSVQHASTDATQRR